MMLPLLGLGPSFAWCGDECPAVGYECVLRPFAAGADPVPVDVAMVVVSVRVVVMVSVVAMPVVVVMVVAVMVSASTRPGH